MTRTALALSPHLDDAVFSCGGTLALLCRTGWRVVVATLFTRSVQAPQGFALLCQLDKGLGPEVDYMALRRAEDRAAMQALGLDDPVHMSLPEAPHRGYASAAALFGPPLPSDDIAGPLREALDELTTAYAPDLILAPQAIGGHVDHVRVVEVLGTPQQPTLWWRDFPYAGRGPAPATPFAEAMSFRPEPVIRLDPGARAAKRAGCLAYASQVGFQFGGPKGLDDQLDAAGSTEAFRGDAGVLRHGGLWPDQAC